MKLLLESWRKYLKEEVVDAQLRFLQKIAADNGEILEYKEEDGKHVMTFWVPVTHLLGDVRGETLLQDWDIAQDGGEVTVKTFFRANMQGEYRTREDAMQWAKEMVEMIQDMNRENREPDYEESLRQRYDQEEAAARREGPSTPLSSEEIAALYDDDGDGDDNVISLFESWRKYLGESKVDPEIINLIEKYVDMPIKAMFLYESNNVLVQLNLEYEPELMEEIQNGWFSSDQHDELQRMGYKVRLASKNESIDEPNVRLTRGLLK